MLLMVAVGWQLNAIKANGAKFDADFSAVSHQCGKENNHIEVVADLYSRYAKVGKLTKAFPKGIVASTSYQKVHTVLQTLPMQTLSVPGLQRVPSSISGIEVMPAFSPAARDYRKKLNGSEVHDTLKFEKFKSVRKHTQFKKVLLCVLCGFVKKEKPL